MYIAILKPGAKDVCGKDLSEFVGVELIAIYIRI